MSKWIVPYICGCVAVLFLAGTLLWQRYSTRQRFYDFEIKGKIMVMKHGNPAIVMVSDNSVFWFRPADDAPYDFAQVVHRGDMVHKPARSFTLQVYTPRGQYSFEGQ